MKAMLWFVGILLGAFSMWSVHDQQPTRALVELGFAAVSLISAAFMSGSMAKGSETKPLYDFTCNHCHKGWQRSQVKHWIIGTGGEWFTCRKCTRTQVVHDSDSEAS